MNEDDLPTQPYSEGDGGFAGALAATFSGLLVVVAIFAIVGTAFYVAVYWQHLL